VRVAGSRDKWISVKLVLQAAQEPPSFSPGSRAGWDSFPLRLLYPGASAQHPPQSCAVPRARTRCGWRAPTPAPARGLRAPSFPRVTRSHPCSRDSTCADILLWVLALLDFQCYLCFLSSVLRQAFAKYPFWGSGKYPPLSGVKTPAFCAPGRR